jgi:VanZ family protein
VPDRHKTSAWPLGVAYSVLVIYASLYPFSGWRDQGMSPWSFLYSPWPKYWTAFDLAANTVGYMPLGFLMALSFLRRGGMPLLGRRNVAAIGVAGLSCALLSFLMEATQTYLPSRVPSNLDFGLNTAGAVLGGAIAVGLELAGAIDRWSVIRERWFVPDARGALVLLALWPFALLFPAAVPFGLGQVLERVEEGLGEWLQDTPFLEWLPVREVELQPLVPAAEMLCVALGLLVPCLIGYSIIRSVGRRFVFACGVLVVGFGATALSAALSWGPIHAWAWLSEPVTYGIGSGFVMALLLLGLPRRGCAAMVMLALGIHLSVLNQAPASAYFTHTLQTWEQGRFIRFNGLAQWLEWLWPYATLVYMLTMVSRRERNPRIEG